MASLNMIIGSRLYFSLINRIVFKILHIYKQKIFIGLLLWQHHANFEQTKIIFWQV